jgi:hypothetical protein
MFPSSTADAPIDKNVIIAITKNIEMTLRVDPFMISDIIAVLTRIARKTRSPL